MKRTICIIGILAIVLNLFGCGLVYIPGTSETEKKRIEESAEKHLNNVLSALESGDKEAFENLFTNDVKVQDNFQIGVDYTFDFFSGKILSCEKAGNYVTGEHIGPKEYMCSYAEAIYKLTTDQKQYLLSFVFLWDCGIRENNDKLGAFELIPADEKYFNLDNGYGIVYWIPEN